MAKTNIELYEALKAPVGDEAARMIAEVVPAADDLATKADMTGARTDLSAEIAATRTDLSADIADLRAEMHREFSQMKGRMFASMVTLWLGVYGTLFTMIAFVVQGR